jgi:UDP-glucose 4-epimerase
VPRLLAGGAGFIGPHFVEAPLVDRNQVSVLGSLSTGRLTNLDGARNNRAFRVVQGSVLDELAVDQVVRECDVVVHSPRRSA